MSGDWMKVQLDTPDKPEIQRIAGILGIDPDAVVGKLIRVWAWFDKHTENGHALGVTYSLLDRITCHAGFAEAMAIVGWLRQDGHDLFLPNFERHNGKTAKNRALSSGRQQLRRGKVTQEVTDLSRSERDKSVTREEKRREEKKEEESKEARKRVFDPMTVERPHWLSLASWSSWCEARKAQRKPLTEPAVRQQLADLTKWHESGHDAESIIANSVRNGYQGLFEPRTPPKPKELGTRSAGEWV